VTQTAQPGKLRTIISAEQIGRRVHEMARQISHDYAGQTIHTLALLENGFIFMADLVRAMEIPVICQFIKPRYRTRPGSGQETLEIFFSHELDIEGQHLLLVEGLVHSGVTSEFLMSDLRSRGAASVKLANPIISAFWSTNRSLSAMVSDPPIKRIATFLTWPPPIPARAIQVAEEESSFFPQPRFRMKGLAFCPIQIPRRASNLG
jgi:hypoxanthine phosphoribosyltransferase